MNNTDTVRNEEHEAVFMLLPWHVNGSLTGDESSKVETHLRSCLVCRRELQALQPLAKTVMEAPLLDISMQASRERLLRDLPVHRRMVSGAQAVPPARRSRRRALVRTLGFAAAALLLVLVAPFGLQQYQQLATPSFRTLATAEAPSGHNASYLRLVFEERFPADRIDALLRDIGGDLVGGPNSLGAYTVRLGTASSSVDASVIAARIRGKPGVVLAEPIVQAQ